MQQYIALLRGINVGGNKKVEMPKLKKVFESLGFDEVSTYINSKVDTLQYIAGAILWNIQRSDYTQSEMKNFIGTEIYKNMTARNINTVRKLGEMIQVKKTRSKNKK